MPDYHTRRRVMVDTQVRPSDVTKFPIIEAMLAVPRELYVPPQRRDAAYVGENIDLGRRRVVLDPRVLAKMLELLDLQADELVLHVGAGLGYGSAVMARLAEAVVALEEDREFAAEAQSVLSAQEVDNAAVIQGPLAEGAAKHGPYDAIMVEGAIEHLPAGLEAQLKDGGRIVAIFMEGALGSCRIGYKLDGALTWRFAFNAAAPVLPGFEKHTGFVL
ncbi:MAG: protein-L-isoaspartate O-methyltransferase [Allgaiera sp.]|nr:protein-L-isoaspartate O-methyltransferase [Allgaiera sp.]